MIDYLKSLKITENKGKNMIDKEDNTNMKPGLPSSHNPINVLNKDKRASYVYNSSRKQDVI